MNYAILTLTGTSHLQQLKEIARCVTGAVSSTADLQFADKSLSQVVIDDINSKWTVNTTLTPIEAGTSTATTTSYIFSAPCAVSSKTKYAWLHLEFAASCMPGIAISSGTGISSSITATMPTMSGMPSSVTTALTSIIAPVTQSGITNGTIYATGVAGSLSGQWQNHFAALPLTNCSSIFSGKHLATASPVPTSSSVGASGFIHAWYAVNKVYVFWNDKTIIISGHGQHMQAIGEFPETTVTTQKGNVPVYAYGSFGYSLPKDSTTVVSLIQEAYGNASIVMNSLYSASTNTTAYRSGSSTELNVLRAPTSVAATLDSSGNQLTPLVPLLVSAYTLGHGVINVSAYSNLYQGPNLCAFTGDLVIVGSSRFMAINSASGTYLIKVA